MVARKKQIELFPSSKNYWSQPGKIAQLEKLVEQGLSASQIADQMGGTTRNAVIGKVHRMGLVFKKASKSNKPAKRVKKTAGNWAFKKDTPNYNFPKSKEIENARRSEVFELMPGEDFVRLDEHKNNQCRCVKEVNGKFIGFCAKLAEPGSSYCKEHGERFQAVVQVNKFRMKEGQVA